MLWKCLVALLSVLSVTNASIVDCGADQSQFKLTQLALTPEPPIPGQDVLMTVVFDNPGPEVTDGLVTNSITLNGLPFSPSTEALCTNTQCPLVVGSNDRSATSQWPTGVSGKIVSRIEWTDTSGGLLLCIEITERVSETHLRTHNKTTHLWDMYYSVSRFIQSLMLSWESQFLLQNLTAPTPLNATNATNATTR